MDCSSDQRRFVLVMTCELLASSEAVRVPLLVVTGSNFR